MTAALPNNTAGHHQWIPLTDLSPSPLNHRKYFDKEKMKELEESIRVQGVVVPILARPLNGEDKFEVVAGERRYRAAKAAGLTEIPAIVRELDDAKALELQVIENNQRVDVHPLEEAEGYEALMQCNLSDGKKYSADDIAAKVGKSRGYVYGRLKLCALCPEARKAFYEDALDASKALLIARIAHHDTQRQALKDLLVTRYDGDTMSYREAHKHVLQTYMLALKNAPFDIKDEKLLPKAGACGPCPKRTGNQTDLFGDVKSADVCTDPKCFDDKRQAHYSVAAKALEAKGAKVVSGDAAKKAFPDWAASATWNRDRLEGKFVKLDDTTYASGRGRKVSELLGPDYEPILIQHPGTGVIIKAATAQAVTAAAQKTSKQREPGRKSAARKASAPKLDPEQVYRQLLLRHVCAALPKKFGDQELRWALEDILLADVDFEVLEELFLPPTKGEKSFGAAQRRLNATIPKLDLEGLSRLAIAALISVDTYGSREGRLTTAAKLYGVDMAAVKAAAKAKVETAEDKKVAEKPAKKKGGKK